MSRVAKNPIKLPDNVEVKTLNGGLEIKGPLGALKLEINKAVLVEQSDNFLKCKPVNSTNFSNAISGTTRALIANYLKGVSEGFERKLLIIGVGFRAQVQGRVLNLTLGYSHSINHKIREGISIETPTPTEIIVKGTDKQVVGQEAAIIRGYRRIEPYKGKGIRYVDEIVVLKEIKKK